MKSKSLLSVRWLDSAYGNQATNEFLNHHQDMQLLEKYSVDAGGLQTLITTDIDKSVLLNTFVERNRAKIQSFCVLAPVIERVLKWLFALNSDSLKSVLIKLESDNLSTLIELAQKLAQEVETLSLNELKTNRFTGKTNLVYVSLEQKDVETLTKIVSAAQIRFSIVDKNSLLRF